MIDYIRLSEVKINHKNWESMKPKNRFDLMLGKICLRDKSIFHEKFVKLPMLDKVIGNADYFFLYDLKCPKGWEYIYFIYNKKTNIVKLGKSKRIWDRINTHVSNFISYGGAELKDIGVIFSRNPFPNHLNVESEFIKYYGDKYSQNIKIKNEFFQTENSRSSIKGILDFLIQHQENLNHD